MPRREQNREFNNILVESIDETITNLLSPQAANAIYSHLEKVHCITKDEIPYRLDTLFSMVENTLGTPSSKTLSKAVAKKLYTKLDLNFPKHNGPSLTLGEYVEEAKVKLRDRGCQF